MTDFSQLVDELAQRTGRLNIKADIGNFVNQIIRECHADEDGNPYIFPRNLIEDQLTADVDSGFTWAVPSSPKFQVMQTVRYTSILHGNRTVYPKFQMPGRRLNDLTHFYYRSGTDFIFAEYGGLNALIDIAYYAMPGRLGYYAVGSRPATYDDTAGWTYYDLTGSGGLDYTQAANQQTARDLVSNWVLLDWPDVVRIGVKAAVYTSTGDKTRSGTHYSKYVKLRNQMIQEEEGQVLDPNQG